MSTTTRPRVYYYTRIGAFVKLAMPASRESVYSREKEVTSPYRSELILYIVRVNEGDSVRFYGAWGTDTSSGLGTLYELMHFNKIIHFISLVYIEKLNSLNNYTLRTSIWDNSTSREEAYVSVRRRMCLQPWITQWYISLEDYLGSGSAYVPADPRGERVHVHTCLFSHVQLYLYHAKTQPRLTSDWRRRI